MPGVDGFNSIAEHTIRIADNNNPFLIRGRAHQFADDRFVASIFKAWHDAGLTEHIRVWTRDEWKART